MSSTDPINKTWKFSKVLDKKSCQYGLNKEQGYCVCMAPQGQEGFLQWEAEVGVQTPIVVPQQGHLNTYPAPPRPSKVLPLK